MNRWSLTYQIYKALEGHISNLSEVISPFVYISKGIYQIKKQLYIGQRYSLES